MAKQFLLVNGTVRSVKPGVDVQTAIENLRARGATVLKIKAPPSMKAMERMVSGIAKATDGCKVEPDGTCCHGHKSWLLQLGFI